jgi:hypothetical protein
VKDVHLPEEYISASPEDYVMAFETQKVIWTGHSGSMCEMRKAQAISEILSM